MKKLLALILAIHPDYMTCPGRLQQWRGMEIQQHPSEGSSLQRRVDPPGEDQILRQAGALSPARTTPL